MIEKLLIDVQTLEKSLITLFSLLYHILAIIILNILMLEGRMGQSAFFVNWFLRLIYWLLLFFLRFL